MGLAARSGAAALMSEQGIDLISPDRGTALFCEEILRGGESSEIVIAGAIGPLDHDGIVEPAPPTRAGSSAPRAPVHARAPAPTGPPGGFDLQRHPILDEVLDYHPGAELVACRTVDPARDPWLLDHVIGGVPLLPGVIGVELIAEAATLLFPDLHFAGLRDLRFHLAVKILKGKPVTLRVRATAVGAAGEDERFVHVRVGSDFVNEAGLTLVSDRCHYEGVVLLSRYPHRPRKSDALAQDLGGREVTPAAAIYGAEALLPHGPRFRVLSEFRLLDGRGAVGYLAPVDERSALAVPEGGSFETAPLAREGAFQTAGLWQALKEGTLGLPHGCRRIEHFGPTPHGSRLIVTAVPVRSAADGLEYRTEVMSEDGLVYDRMEGFSTIPAAKIPV